MGSVWSLYETQAAIQQCGTHSGGDAVGAAISPPPDTTSSKTIERVENHIQKVEDRLESLESQYRAMQGTLQQTMSEVKHLKTFTATSINENQQELSQTKVMLTKMEQNSEKSRKSFAELIQNLTTDMRGQKERLATLEGKNVKIAKEAPARTLRSSGVPKTSSHFNASADDDEDDDDDDDESSSDDENSKPDASEEAEKFEQSLNAWDGESDLLSEAQKSEEEDPKIDENATDGLHNTLHQVIICLRSQAYTDHRELDAIVDELKNVARLEYPSSESTRDVSVRQALILKLVTCLYQTVCVVSMEREIPCDQIYGREEVFLTVVERIQAMI